MSEVNSIKPKKICSFPGCGKVKESRSLCATHASQSRRGELLKVILPRRRRGSPPRITCDEVSCPEMGTPCHVFRGSKTHGYGQIMINKKPVRVHRRCWETEVGPIPEGMFIDHVCRNRACCNVDHLRVVTPKVNSTENIIGTTWQKNGSKTHCKHGHPFDESSFKKKASGKIHRVCMVCKKEKAREWINNKIKEEPGYRNRMYRQWKSRRVE